MTTVLLSGLAAAAAAEWILLSLLQFHSGLPVILFAAIHLALVLGANAFGVHAMVKILRLNEYGIVGRSQTTAAWLAPLAVYLQAGSIWCIPVAAIVASKAAILVRSLRPPKPDSWIASDETVLVIHLIQPAEAARPLWFFVAAICLEAAVVGGVQRRMDVAALCVSAGAALAASFVFSGAKFGTLTTERRSIASTLMTLVVALSLTAGYVGSGSGDGITAEQHLSGGASGAYWGVVLWPDEDSKPIRLIAPSRRNTGLMNGPRVPIRIPFDGVYWYFRSPNVRPPEESVTAHGSPDRLRFRSTDSTPLTMEAHQTLAAPVDLSCCSRIDVAVNNGETEEVVHLELLLADSSDHQRGAVSLGSADVRPTARAQVLHFPVPQYSFRSVFDELTIRFDVDMSRETESAKVSIQYLLLIPRLEP